MVRGLSGASARPSWGPGRPLFWQVLLLGEWVTLEPRLGFSSFTSSEPQFPLALAWWEGR